MNVKLDIGNISIQRNVAIINIIVFCFREKLSTILLTESIYIRANYQPDQTQVKALQQHSGCELQGWFDPPYLTLVPPERRQNKMYGDQPFNSEQ